MHVSIVVEGATDEPIARRLAAESGLEVHSLVVKRGKARLDADLSKYAAAARQSPWLVLRDLDHDAPCAPEWMADKPTGRWLCLRLAVREAEAWLLADRERIAEFLAVRPALVPEVPDELDDPKAAVVKLARRSGVAAVRKRLVPRPGALVAVGQAYEASLIEFAWDRWRPGVAAKRSESLRRARAALARLSTDWHAFLGEQE